MDEVSSSQSRPEIIGCTPPILSYLSRHLGCLFYLGLSPFLPQLPPGWLCLTSCPKFFFSIVSFYLLLLPIALPLLSLQLSPLLPSRLVSQHALWLVCLSQLLAETYSLLVHLLVEVPQAYVFLLLSLPLSYFGVIHLIYPGARCFCISTESG